MRMRRRQSLSVLLSIIGVSGTIATALLSRKAAIKELKNEVTVGEDDRGLWYHNINKKDILKIYAPTLIVGGATVASIVSSSILSRRTEASLISMAVLADQGWRKYKYQVKDLLGTSVHSDILKGVAKNGIGIIPDDLPEDDTRKLYFEDHIGFFLADPEKLAYAYGDMNQRLQVVEYGVSAYYVMIYDFVKDFEILDTNIKKEDLQWGWTMEYLNEMCGYVWIHWFFREDETPDGTKYTVIEWGEEPILNPSNYGECWLEEECYDKEAYSPAKGIENTKE